jgi:hypothetical protein
LAASQPFETCACDKKKSRKGMQYDKESPEMTQDASLFGKKKRIESCNDVGKGGEWNAASACGGLKGLLGPAGMTSQAKINRGQAR